MADAPRPSLPTPEESPTVTEDALYGGRVRLLQLREGHRAGTDAVLLASALMAEAGELIADLGAGSGAVGLMIAVRSPAHLLLVERDPALVALCGRNVALNGLADRARVIEADLLADAAERRRAGLVRGMADAIATNPPFLDATRGRASPDRRRESAHVLAGEDGLARWLRACADLLRPKGRLALIHRADRLDACLQVLSPSFGAVRLRAVHPRAEATAIRVVLTAVKGSRAALAIAPALVLHGPDGGFTPQAAALHRGDGGLM